MNTKMMESLQREVERIQGRIAELPRGTVSKKTINGKVRCYHQWYEDGKTVSRYLKESEIGPLEEAIGVRKLLERRLEELNARFQVMELAERYSLFADSVLTGVNLAEWASAAEGMEHRDGFERLRRYLARLDETVCMISGPPGTGKTTMIRQAALGMSQDEQSQTAYLPAREYQTMDVLLREIRLMRDAGIRTVFIDGITQIDDFPENASDLQLPVELGMRVVVTGDDTVALRIAGVDGLLFMTRTIRTTYMSFREFSRVTGCRDVDAYAMSGGVLCGGHMSLETGLFEDSPSLWEYPEAKQYLVRWVLNNSQRHLQRGAGDSSVVDVLRCMARDKLPDAIAEVLWDIVRENLVAVIGDVPDCIRTDVGLTDADASFLADRIRHEPCPLACGTSETITDVQRALVTQHLMEMGAVIDYRAERRGAGARNHMITQPVLEFAMTSAIVDTMGDDPLFRQRFGDAGRRVVDYLRGLVRRGMLVHAVIRDTRETFGKDFEVLTLSIDRSYTPLLVSHRRTGRNVLISVADAVVEASDAATIDCSETDAYVERMYGPVVARLVLHRGGDADAGKFRLMDIAGYLSDPEGVIDGLMW